MPLMKHIKTYKLGKQSTKKSADGRQRFVLRLGTLPKLAAKELGWRHGTKLVMEIDEVDKKLIIRRTV